MQTRPDITITEEPDGTIVIRLESEQARLDLWDSVNVDKDNISFFLPSYSKPLKFDYR